MPEAIADGATVPNHFDQLAIHEDNARVAATGAFILQQAMREDSRNIARGLVGTSEGLFVNEEWPLVLAHLAEVSVGRAVTTTFWELDYANSTRPELTAPESLWSKHFDDATLSEVYGLSQLENKVRFIADISEWADQMALRGWPVIFKASLGERYRLELFVYKDTEAVRQYFDARLTTDEDRTTSNIFQTGRGFIEYGTPAFEMLVEDLLSVRQSAMAVREA